MDLEQWKQTYINLYAQIQKWISPYLGGKVSIKDVDVFAIWPFVEIKQNKKENFTFINKEKFYVFHERSGYLIHVFSPYVFSYIKSKFGEKSISKIRRIEPGRRVIYGERIVDGPRGGKLFALGSTTYITANPNILHDSYTRKYLINLRLKYSNQRTQVWPNIGKIEQRLPLVPFYKIFTLALEFPWPEFSSSK